MLPMPPTLNILLPGLSSERKKFMKKLVDDTPYAEFGAMYPYEKIPKSYLNTPATRKGDYIVSYLLIMLDHRDKKFFVNGAATDDSRKIAHVMRAYQHRMADKTAPVKAPFKYVRSGSDQHGLSCMHIAAMALSPGDFEFMHKLMLHRGMDARTKNSLHDDYSAMVSQSLYVNGSDHRLHNLLFRRDGWNMNGEFSGHGNKIGKWYLKAFHNANFDRHAYKNIRKQLRPDGGKSVESRENMLANIFRSMNLSSGPTSSGRTFNRAPVAQRRNASPTPSYFTPSAMAGPRGPNSAGSVGSNARRHTNNTPLRTQHTPMRSNVNMRQVAQKRSRANNNTATSSGASGSTRGPLR